MIGGKARVWRTFDRRSPGYDGWATSAGRPSRRATRMHPRPPPSACGLPCAGLKNAKVVRRSVPEANQKYRCFRFGPALPLRGLATTLRGTNKAEQ